jgi:hypothetical protein
VKTGFETFNPVNEALRRIAKLEAERDRLKTKFTESELSLLSRIAIICAENAALREALRDIDLCLPTDESMDQAHEMIGAALVRTQEAKP